MVIGCIVFTLPHFLSPDNESMSGGGIAYLQSVHHSIPQTKDSSVQPNTFQPHSHDHNPSNLDRLNNSGSSSIYAYSNYNNRSQTTVGNETFISLRQTQAGDADNLGSNPVQLRQGRNSICHSVNPQSSPFIQGATHRLNLDLETVSSGIYKIHTGI